MAASWIEMGLKPEDRRKCVERALLLLEGREFDAIVITGVSGGLIGPIVAERMGVPLVVVRKGMDDSHSRRTVETLEGVRTVVLVDDFVRTGDTVRRVRYALAEREIQLVGIAQYAPLWRLDNTQEIDEIPVWGWDIEKVTAEDQHKMGELEVEDEHEV